jgi:hypothetical protein
LDKGTISFPKAKEYQKMIVPGMELGNNKGDSSYWSSEGSDSKEEKSQQEEESEGKYYDEDNADNLYEPEQRNWWDSPLDWNN